MDIRKLVLALGALALASSLSLSGQNKKDKDSSQSFKMGQWVEINNAILKQLDRFYVDSLPLARMQREGIDAMLENLDPYTVYIPEEENEDLQIKKQKRRTL